MKPVIEVTNLSKSYQISHQEKASYDTIKDDFAKLVKKPFGGGSQNEQETFWALKDINFQVNRGESFGIIGKNGSGKSTLLKILSRIVDPTTGTVKIDGKVASLLEVGTGFHPELTGRENIYFNGSMIGMSKQEITKKFDEIVAFSEVEKFLDTPVKFYSSGMFVRLAFSVAAHLDSEILILDEVLSVGDAGFQKKSLAKMMGIVKEGRTILFVSHSVASVAQLCDRALLLKKGKIVEIGETRDVIGTYTGVTEAKDNKSINQRSREQGLSLEAKITELDLISDKVRGLKTVDTTKPITFRFEIVAKKNLKDTVVHFAIITAGQMVLRFHPEFMEQTFSLKKGKNVIECEVEPTFLTGGEYSVDCSLLFRGREKFGHIDAVDNAYVFQAKNIIMPNGKDTLTQREAFYYVPQKWRQID